jgi:thioredoxin reductase (NADPH)
MAEMRAQAERFGAEIIQGNVTAVEVGRRPFTVRTSDAEFESRSLIVATGASARTLNLPGERTLMGHGVSTCATCDGYWRDTLRASKIMQDKARQNSKIAWMLTSEVASIEDAAKGELTAVVVRNTVTGALSRLEVSGLFIAIGHTPNTELLRGQLELDAGGYIITRNGSKTSVSGVFACGDVQDHVYRQAVTAAGSGCMAAIDAEHYLEGVPEDVRNLVIG